MTVTKTAEVEEKVEVVEPEVVVESKEGIGSKIKGFLVKHSEGIKTFVITGLGAAALGVVAFAVKNSLDNCEENEIDDSETSPFDND